MSCSTSTWFLPHMLKLVKPNFSSRAYSPSGAVIDLASNGVFHGISVVMFGG